MTSNDDVRRFFAYLKTFKRRFFGKNELSLVGFISIYLNYDTDYNPFRQAILNCSTKLEKEMTIDCLAFVKEANEEKGNVCFLNAPEFLGKGVVVTKPLEKVLIEAMNENTQNLHEFMNFVLTYEPVHEFVVSYFETCFDVSFKKMMKFSKVYFMNIEEEENDELCLSEVLSQCSMVVDGRREEYKLFVGDDCKDNIWGMMLKYESNNVIIVGNHDDMIQKYIYNMAYEVSHGVSCLTRRDAILLEVDIQAILQQFSCEEEFVEGLQKAVQELLALENKEKVIVYLKNFNVLLKNRGDGFSYMFFTFPLLQDEELRVIINMNEPELKSVCANNRFTSLFEFLFIPTPDKEEFVPYMLGQVFDLAIHHGVYADGKNIETTLQYVRAMDYGGNVIGTRSLLDYVMAFVNSEGRYIIFESDYVEYFKMNFHEQEKQADEYKKLIAFHEAGHFVVSRFCKHYKAVYSDLVSVISIADTGGVNLMEYDTSLAGTNDYNFYMEALALSLAGRASEELFLESVSAGAVSDLEQATELATAMITNLGMDKSKKIKGNENMMSERAMNEVSDKVNEILTEAYELAIQMLTEHEEYVKTLAEKLMVKKILSRKEILEMEVKEGDIIYLR